MFPQSESAAAAAAAESSTASVAARDTLLDVLQERVRDILLHPTRIHGRFLSRAFGNLSRLLLLPVPLQHFPCHTIYSFTGVCPQIPFTFIFIAPIAIFCMSCVHLALRFGTFTQTLEAQCSACGPCCALRTRCQSIGCSLWRPSQWIGSKTKLPLFDHSPCRSDCTLHGAVHALPVLLVMLLTAGLIPSAAETYTRHRFSYLS